MEEEIEASGLPRKCCGVDSVSASLRVNEAMPEAIHTTRHVWFGRPLVVYQDCFENRVLSGNSADQRGISPL